MKRTPSTILPEYYEDGGPPVGLGYKFLILLVYILLTPMAILTVLILILIHILRIAHRELTKGMG